MKNLILLLTLCTLFSCGDVEGVDVDACDLPALEKKSSCDGPDENHGLTALELMDLYVVDEELVVQKKGDLWYVIVEPGGSKKPTSNSTVKFDYSGYYRNDCSFDKANDITFTLTNLIEGWKIGIPLVGKCGVIKLIVPPSLAYGDNPNNGIKKGEPLIFDINVLDF